jgi:hypothetical protein
MTHTHTPVNAAYAIAYGKGREAAKMLRPSTGNPYKPDSVGFHGWNDGYYDEQSARTLAIDRHSASIWSNDAN